MNVVIITNCTARKVAPPAHHLRGGKLARDSIGRLAKRWAALLSTARIVYPAQALYRGTSMAVARKAVKEHRGALYVASAGVGLVKGTDAIPAYDLTVSSKSRSNILAKVRDAGSRTPDAWWTALSVATNKPNQFGKLLQQQPSSLILVALPAPYLRMVMPELVRLTEKQRQNIRIFASRGSPVPKELEKLVMPYDTRLNGRKSPYRGPAASFSQRAASHFLSLIPVEARKHSPAAHAELVRKALALLPKPRRKVRQRIDNIALEASIRKLKSEGFATSSRALRHFRDEFGLACEQRRFNRVWQSLATR